MQASRVTIGPDLLSSGKLNRAKKKALREKLIKEYINSRPYGSAISLKELSSVCQYKSPGEVGPLLSEMVSLGVLCRERIPGKNAYSYTVAGELHITTTKAEKTLIDYAKDYAWQHDTDSLREFIIYMEHEGKIWLKNKS
jgi:hypothetical protein